MVSVIDSDNFVLSLLVTVFIQLTFYVAAVLTRSENLYDFAGGLNYIVVFALTLGLSDDRNENTRGIVLTVLVCISRAFLGGFLLFRVLSRKGDGRFDEARENPCQFLVFWVFQIAWVFLIASPVIYVNGSGASPELGGVDYLGFAMVGFGILFQIVADIQKYQFRANKENRGKVCDRGVWSVSRHPNYFGEVVIWWGAFVVAVRPIQDQEEYFALWTVISPIFTMFLLLFVSGIPLAEGQKLGRFMKTAESKDEFMEYFTSTPPLIPFIPIIYKNMPNFVKCLLCCEFPMYAYDEKKEALNNASGENHDSKEAKVSEEA
mmetsp:Transcript_3892/g.5559  ORF Transcript_3892/g.5559 Transcript_3892/m.5559 type:complete len:320 (-) Transcript_3892:205-1164(-)|eukprot:CAMPEP_0184487650 /NCGR_PEP_ID=MMETSP0113_2-20130426/10243_1 /TAXON_ID=91329 /ORGANISM="Norrisiella sphaerica, Strain BC52" /LENGTH=319 /DNA_ID=CAMNT_0026870019 /DNA_START=165 /DNA_END=1124 /DNA_ORIENTATION=+